MDASEYKEGDRVKVRAALKDDSAVLRENLGRTAEVIFVATGGPRPILLKINEPNHPLFPVAWANPVNVEPLPV
jgi:hypothetical protein